MSNTPKSQHRYDLSLSEVTAILRMRWVSIAALAALVFFTALVLTALTTPIYQAKATVHLLQHTTQEVRTQDAADTRLRGGVYGFQAYYLTNVRIMTSTAVLTRALEYYGETGLEDLPPTSQNVAALRKAATSSVVPDSELLSISVDDSNPERAALLANSIARSFQFHSLQVRRDGALEATDWLDQRIQTLREKQKSASDTLLEFKRRHNIADIEETVTSLSAKTYELSQAYGVVGTEAVRLEAIIGAREELLAKGHIKQLAQVVESSLMQTLTVAYGERLAEQASAAARYGPQHPEMKRADAQIIQLESRIQAEVLTDTAAKRSLLKLKRAEEAKLVEALDAAKQALLDHQRLIAEYDSFAADLERNRSLYDKLGKRKDELELSSQTQLNNVRLIEHATVPSAPIRPRWLVNILVSLVLGIGLGAGVALFREFIDDTLASPADVEVYLKAPFLGITPALPDGLEPRAAGLYNFDNPNSPIAESLRSVRTVLSLGAHGDPKRLLITSSVASEGKTDTTSRIGAAYAAVGRRVLVIDADLRRSRMHKVFDVSNQVGLTTALSGSKDPLQCVVATEVPNLHIMPSGPFTDQPHELLSGPSFPHVLDALGEHYDILIVDTPPAAIVSDALLLSRHVDGVVVVARAHVVSRHLVKITLDRLASVDSKLFGVLINAVEPGRSAGAGNYYGYASQYYGHDAARDGEQSVEKS